VEFGLLIGNSNFVFFFYGMIHALEIVILLALLNVRSVCNFVVS
jgi:hypothetical protein